MSTIFTIEALTEELEDLVDESITIQAEIKQIQLSLIKEKEERYEAIKTKIEREMKDWGLKNIRGKMWQATLVTTSRKNLDKVALFAAYKIPDDAEEKYTEIKTSEYVKVSAFK